MHSRRTGPPVGQDQAGVEEADEWRADAGELVEDRAVDRGDDVGRLVRHEVLERAVGPHPAGVRSRVAVTEPLVVARRREGHGRVAVGQCDHRRLRTEQPPLQDHPGTTRGLGGAAGRIEVPAEQPDGGR